MPPKKRVEPAPAARTKGSGSNNPPAPVQPAPSELENGSARQLKAYEQAIRTFHEQRFSEAIEQFKQATIGPLRPVAHNARLHVAICERRVQPAPLQFDSAEDHYNYAVTRINAGDLGAARQHLLQAQKLDPAADYIYYGLAACDALSGDVPAACENLKRAIEIDPRNRLNARQDPDFAEAARQPLLHQLLHPEKAVPL